MLMDHTGVSHTCPLIDNAIAALEDVRSANIELRDFGNEKAEEVLELELTISARDSKIDELEYEIRDLKSEIESLNDQITELQIDISNSKEY